jgi:hypothetical protein
MTQDEVKAAMREGKINLKWRPCPTDSGLEEVYIKQTNEVVFVGTPDDHKKYINEILFGKGGCPPPTR